MKILKNILIILGALFFFDGAVSGLISNFNIGVLLTVFLGLLLGLWGIFFEQICEKTGRGFLRVLKYVILAGLAFSLGLCTFLAFYGNIDTADYSEDVCLVLGCAVNGERPTLLLTQRLNTALRYVEKNPSALIVVSGGQGSGENLSEAAVMAEYLTAHGVSEDRIITEDKSTSTNENFRFSKELLDSRLGGNYRVAAITNDFHIFRAGRIAKNAGVNVKTVHAPTSMRSIPPSYLREILAVIKLWVCGY